MNVLFRRTSLRRLTRIARDPHRCASTYVIVLGTSLAVTMIGLSALAVARVERDAYSGAADRVSARFLARTGIERALHEIDIDPDWRRNRSVGKWISDQPLGRGTYSVSVDDPVDGILSDDDRDPLVLTGAGIAGAGEYGVRVRVEPVPVPLTCLEVAWCSGDDLLFADGSVTTADKTLTANNSASASDSAVINADVEAVNSISGSGYQGSTTTGVAPRTLPDPVTVFDYYVANGTAIDVALLAYSDEAYVLENSVLSPTSNPYGTPDPQGVYVIDCQAADILIRQMEVTGTIVLLSAGMGSKVVDVIRWEPAVVNFPSLLVQGSVEVSQSDGSGVVMKGLVYADGNVTTSASPAFSGVVVSGTTSSFAGTVNVTYQNTYFNNPPPGFFEITAMKVSSGTFGRWIN